MVHQQNDREKTVYVVYSILCFLLLSFRTIKYAKSIKQRTLFTDDAPNSSPSQEVKRIVNNLVYRLERKVLNNKGDRGFGNFLKSLIERF